MIKSLREVKLPGFKLLLSVFLLVASQGCSLKEGSSKYNGDPGELWSVRMANSVMARNDSLLLYNGVPAIKWQYDIAFLGMAIDKLGDTDKTYSSYMEDFMNYFITVDGEIRHYDLEKYNLDYVNPAKNLITLYKRTGNEKYRKAIDRIILQLEGQPRTKSGGFWHKEIYPWQMWLDGIYMSSPFMAQYAREFNSPEWFDEVLYQVIHIYDKTLDPETNLLYHAWDESRSQRWCNPETGQSKHFWGRSMGWYMMAIVDVLDYLPEEYAGREKLIKILQTTADALIKVRDPQSALWFQVLDRGASEGNYLEGSASAMFTYVFAKGAKEGYLDKVYMEYAEESFEGMLKHFIIVEEDSLLTMNYIVGGCGLGGNPYRDGSFEYYITEKRVDNDPKGVAPFIMAALELNR